MADAEERWVARYLGRTSRADAYAYESAKCDADARACAKISLVSPGGRINSRTSRGRKRFARAPVPWSRERHQPGNGRGHTRQETRNDAGHSQRDQRSRA